MNLKSLKKIDAYLYEFIASRKFFYCIIIMFGLMAAWVATASLYPMAFDEDFHMGVINIYSHLWAPVIKATPDMAKYGNVVADPSYLFHYLMSFPYRFERDVMHLSEAASIIGLRFINIGFFLASLAIFWRALGLAGLSVFARNVILALLCLIPISPLLAGQVNYDNLLMVVVSLTFLLVIRIIIKLKQKHRLPASDIWWLTFVILIGTATKYAFLPIAATVVMVLAVVALTSIHRGDILKNLAVDTGRLKFSIKITLLILVGIGVILNVRYATNLINYNRISPSCDTFFTVEDCREYGPYGRTYILRQELDPNFEPKSVVAYMVEDWVEGMSYRLFFTVAGPTNDYDTQQPVVIPQVIYTIGIIIGGLLFVLYLLRSKRNNPVMWLFVMTVVVYCLILLYQLYNSYKNSGVAVALNGRYLLPIVPIIGAAVAMSLSGAKIYKNKLAFRGLITATILLLVLVEGGGIGTYVVRGKSEWFWSGWGQSSQAVMQDILDPITLK